MEIVGSGVSVYEVELDLKDWTQADTGADEGFCGRLAAALPSLAEHPA